MNSSGKVISLDYKNKEQVHAVAKLHKELLGGPIPELGYEFMTRFYYTKLVKAGLIKCDLYQYEGTYVAFSVYTKYPFTFMEQGKRRFFVYLCFLISKSILLKPCRLKTIFKVMKLNSMRLMNQDEDRVGDSLSFGVLAPYLKLRDETTGLRISNFLFERAADYFRKEGFIRMQGTVQKDNKPALFMWYSHGASITNYKWGGEDSYIISLKL